MIHFNKPHAPSCPTLCIAFGDTCTCWSAFEACSWGGKGVIQGQKASSSQVASPSLQGEQELSQLGTVLCTPLLLRKGECAASWCCPAALALCAMLWGSGHCEHGDWALDAYVKARRPTWASWTTQLHRTARLSWLDATGPWNGIAYAAYATCRETCTREPSTALPALSL